MDSFENEEAVKQIVICNTKFAFNLYKELIAASGEDGNFAVSPFAISVALAVAYRGANENTADQLRQAMKFDLFDMDAETVHKAYAELIDHILNKSPNCNFTMLNGIFAQQGFDFEEDFEQSMKEEFLAEARLLDFGSSLTECCTEINQWVENATALQVRDIIPELNQDTLLVLVNAAMFKGQWMRKFDNKARREFYYGDTPTKTSFVGATSEFNHVVLDDLQAEAVEIPYVNNDLSFIVVLPNEKDGLASTEEQMTGDAVEEVVSNMVKQRMQLQIPKFRLDFGLDLEEALRKLDITDMFTLGEADMSGVDGTEALSVAKFPHRTILEIGEEGEPGQADGGGSGAAREFVADHPFLYFVRDNRTESILMMGRYQSPPAKMSDDGLGTRMGMSVKNVFKRMSSKDPASPASPTTPTTPAKRNDSTKRQAPPPPPAAAQPQKQPPQTFTFETTDSGVATNSASYETQTQQVNVNTTKQTPPPPQKKKKKSSGLFCCLKATEDIDFDSV